MAQRSCWSSSQNVIRVVVAVVCVSRTCRCSGVGGSRIKVRGTDAGLVLGEVRAGRIHGQAVNQAEKAALGAKRPIAGRGIVVDVAATAAAVAGT